MSDVTINYGSSSIYSKEDMDAAIKAIKTVFKDFEGCELHSISYSSDDQCNTADHIAWMNELEAANDNKETSTSALCLQAIFILRKMAAVHGILMKNIPAGNGGWLALMAVNGN